MKKNRVIFFLFFCILFASLVNAGWLDDGSCQVNTDCIISVRLINDSSGELISDGNCTLSVYDTNYTLFLNTTMANLTQGFYNHTISINKTGKFPSFVTCNYKGNVDWADVTFDVSDPNYNEYLYLLLLIIPLILHIIGRKEDEPAFTMIAGFLLAIFGIGMLMGYFPRMEMSYLTVFFSAITMGIGVYLLVESSMKYIGRWN